MPADSDPILPLGSVFEARYDVQAELAAGSFGRVYRAVQRSTGQDVAVKVLRFSGGDAAVAANQRERFRREMRLSAELSHPNIVPLIDSGETDEGILFAAFQYVPGATLERVLAEEGKLGLPETVRLMTQVLDALSCAHARGVIHRDLKPGNIMVTRTGVLRNAMVLDFGLAGFVRDMHASNLPRITATFEIMGTPGYAAPEQLRGEPPSPRSDLYSWALTFLECVTGELAVRGAGYEVIMNQLGSTPIPIPAALRAQPIGRVLEIATDKQVGRRNVTIEELMYALDAVGMPEVPRPTAPEPESQRRQLTVVACRSTMSPLDDALDIEELDESARGQLRILLDVAARHGGQVASVQSDRVLVAFGFPHAREDDARRAARAALDIAAESARFRARLEREGRAQIDIRVGVHTGLVITRATARLDDLVGVTPQIAVALAEIANPGEVLASDDTQRLLHDEIDLDVVGEHRLPGLSRAVPVFRVTGDRRTTRRAETLHAHETPLVGRTQQLSQLLQSWGDIQAGRAGATLISGEAGIGKTRILRELRRRIASGAWVEARCGAEAQNSPLRPIVDALAPMAESSLEAWLARYGMDAPDTVSLLATLLGAPASDRRAPLQLSPERQRELTLDAVLKLFLRMAAQQPLVLAIEDLHWADPTTLELTRLLVEELQTAPVWGDEAAPRLFVVFTTRPEFAPPWPAGQAVLMHLGRLPPEDVEAMVASALSAGGEVPRPILEQVVQHADGVPLFVEEVTRTLLDSGSSSKRRSSSDRVGFAIPTTLRDLLTARLDGLSSRARDTAQLGAVLGREFRYELLRAIATQSESALREDLAELGGAGLVFHRRSAADETYVFKHALLRDAAYESMVKATRRQLHARVADRLRERFPDVCERRPELMAQHCESGGQIARAIEYWKLGGDAAMRRGAYAESISLFEKGLALLAELPSARELPGSRARLRLEIELTEALGTALLATQGYASPEVEGRFAHALELCRELGGDVDVRALYGIWAVHITRSDAAATADLLPKLRHLADTSNDPVALYTAHGAAGIWAFATGDFRRARDESAKAITWYHADELRAFVRDAGYDGRLHVHGWLLWSLNMLGHADQALQVRDEMLALAEQSAHPYAIALALTFAGGLAHDRGEPAAARELADRTIAIATEEKLYFWLATGTCVRGWASLRDGDLDAGIAQIQQGLGILKAIGINATYSYYQSFLAEAHLASGAVADGLAVVDEALHSCRTLLDRFAEPELYRLRGELRLKGGDDADAEDSFRQALDISRDRGARWSELRATMSLGRLLRSRGAAVEARALVAGVYGGFSEGFETGDLRDARALLDELTTGRATASA